MTTPTTGTAPLIVRLTEAILELGRLNGELDTPSVYDTVADVLGDGIWIEREQARKVIARRLPMAPDTVDAILTDLAAAGLTIVPAADPEMVVGLTGLCGLCGRIGATIYRSTDGLWVCERHIAFITADADTVTISRELYDHLLDVCQEAGYDGTLISLQDAALAGEERP
jgi:hypothetical protein